MNKTDKVNIIIDFDFLFNLIFNLFFLLATTQPPLIVYNNIWLNVIIYINLAFHILVHTNIKCNYVVFQVKKL